MKRKILFILSSDGTGGIISSFTSLYNAIYDKYDIKVIFAASNEKNKHPFSHNVIYDSFLTAYNVPFSLLNPWHKLLSLLLRPYKVYNIRKDGNFPLLLSQFVANRLMHKYNFDIVVGYSEGLPTRITSCFKQAKKITWIHCDYQRYYDEVCRVKDELDIYSKIDNIICVSNYTRKKFEYIYPSLSQRTLYIYNLLDVERIRRMSHESVDDNRFKTDCFTIISVGRIDPVKRFTEIPLIAKFLKDRHINFRWYILGPQSRYPELPKLLNLISHYGVEAEVQWLNNKSNPYAYMSRSDLFVCLSSSEACPMVFNEAKILGLPILSTSFGSANEFVSNGNNGFISPLQQLSCKLLELIADNSHLEQLKMRIKEDGINNEDSLNKIDKLFSIS